MWSRVSEELGVPWRAAEAMHWQLGEQDMARRAGVVPFSLSSIVLEPPQKGRRGSSTSARARKEPATRMTPALLPPVSEQQTLSGGYFPLLEGQAETEKPPSPDLPKEP